MKWYTDVAPLLKRDVAYDHRELVEKLETIKPGLTKSGYHWAISCLVSEGVLERKGRGEYGLSDGNVRSDYSPRYSNIAAGLLDMISDQYPNGILPHDPSKTEMLRWPESADPENGIREPERNRY